LKNTVLVKVYCALAFTAEPASADVFFLRPLKAMDGRNRALGTVYGVSQKKSTQQLRAISAALRITS